MSMSSVSRKLAAEGIFEIIADVLRSHNKTLVSAGTKIISCFLDVVPSTLRSYVIQQDDSAFLGILVKGVVTGLGCDIHDEVLEIFQKLVGAKETPRIQQGRIVQIFCEGYLDELMDVIESCCLPKNDSHRAESDAAYKPESLLNICELLRFCAIHHFNTINFFFYLSDVVNKVLYLTRRRETFLAVAAVRFFRAIISSGADDELFLEHIVYCDLLKPVIDAFTGSSSRDNMLHSTVLELLDYIRKADIKVLLACLVDRFWMQLAKFEHLGAVQALFDKHEESSHNSETKDACDTIGLRENVDQSDEDDDAISESHEQDQTAETSKPDAAEVNEKAGSAGNADPDNRDNDGGHRSSPQAKRSKPPADGEDPSSSSAASHESEWEGSKRRKSV